MHISERFGKSPVRLLGRTAITAFAFLIVSVFVAHPARAQTFSVIHKFRGGQDGDRPFAGLTIDSAGNLYGTNLGEVFELSHRDSGWVFTRLYLFRGGYDGASAEAKVIFGPDGTLYGTTLIGGGTGCNGYGCGTVFNLRPPPRSCISALCSWTETVLHHFTGVSDGAYPRAEVIFDGAGNIFLTTQIGGSTSCGTVVQLTPSSQGWQESVIYSFGDRPSDGCEPWSGLTIGQAGDLYGTTRIGGDLSCVDGCGTIYQLTHSGGKWIEDVLWRFQFGKPGDVYPFAGVILNKAGSLFGATVGWAGRSSGAAFELSTSNGALSQIYGFQGPCCSSVGPSGSLTMDGAGNLYGATFAEGIYGAGNIFKLTASNVGWTYTDLYDFTGGNDGAHPNGPLVLDANGNLYGTTTDGGDPSCFPEGCGVVFEIAH